jgi:hypothetical protein
MRPPLDPREPPTHCQSELSLRPILPESLTGATAAAIVYRLLCVSNLQTGEVAFSAGTDPKRHASRGIAELEIIHGETRLRRAMHIEARLCAFR